MTREEFEWWAEFLPCVKFNTLPRNDRPVHEKEANDMIRALAERQEKGLGVEPEAFKFGNRECLQVKEKPTKSKRKNPTPNQNPSNKKSNNSIKISFISWPSPIISGHIPAFSSISPA